jgi:hypothetical protein
MARTPKSWVEFRDDARPQTNWSATGRILCLDPGLTTGWATFRDGNLEEYGQWDTPEAYTLADTIYALHVARFLDLIVFESYAVRGNKFKEHVGSEVMTIQLIGAIKVAAHEYGIPFFSQTPAMAKGFCTDTKLREWGLYQSVGPHARDAIRHGCHYLLFNVGKEAKQ